MIVQHDTSTAHTRHLEDSTTWANLYLLLRPIVKRWVYPANVPSWKGQEEDVVEDIVQVAIIRLFNYSQRAECGEVEPVDSPEHMVKIIALNYCRDLQRKERRLLRSALNDCFYEEPVDNTFPVEPSEIAVENMYEEGLFKKLAKHIVSFPDKQRNALLIDLANLMHFGKKPTLLQRAFLNEGVKLQDFRYLVPKNPRERNRYQSSLSTAYKRLDSCGLAESI